MFGEFMTEHPRWAPALRELDTRIHRESDHENARDDYPGAHPALFLVALVVLVVVVPLNLTVVNPALVSIEDAFAAPIRTGQWVVSAYAAAIAVAVLPAGRLVDLRWPRSAATVGALVLCAGLVAAAGLCHRAGLAARVHNQLFTLCSQRRLIRSLVHSSSRALSS